MFVVEDRFVPGSPGEPKLDDHQDVKLLATHSDNSSTSIIFTRKVIPCDVEEDVPIREQATSIIFAYGKGAFGYHGENRGSVSVYFHSTPADSPLLPNDTKVMQLAFPAYEIPATDTTYVCIPGELPYQQKTHIVRWRPLITPGNELYVHHMVIFVCDAPQKASGPYGCSMAPRDCSTILIGWSVGQTGQDWLGDYAMPIGGEGGIRHVVLQMHYNNPTEVTGLVDRSGIEIYYTPTLRKYDMGSLVVSTNWGRMVIPPKVITAPQSAECPSECTKKFSTPVTMVSYIPHMHQIGQQIWMQHIRDGEELPEIHRDDYYDFQRQQFYDINVPLLPGDRLRLSCVWNSMSRTVNTTGGESSSQEMCVALIQYYPLDTQFMTCTDSGTYEKARCGGTVNMTTYTYKPLPAPVSTCKDEAEVSAAAVFTPFAVMIGILVVILIA